MIRRLEAGVMPLGGYNGQRGAKLPEEEIQALRAWVGAGALAPPRRGDVARPFISESQVLHAIVQDLEAAPKANRPFLRYFSLANLWNASDVDTATLGLYRAALGKLVNHLSWKKEIVRPAETGLANTLLRIDLRNYRWNDQTWDRITAAYPYGAMSGDYRREAAKIHELSGAAPPYLRADWFIASASVSPLYS